MSTILPALPAVFNGLGGNPFKCPNGGSLDSVRLFLPVLTVSDSCWRLRTVLRRSTSSFVSSRLPGAVDDLEVSESLGPIAADWTGESMLDWMEFERLLGFSHPSSV